MKIEVSQRSTVQKRKKERERKEKHRSPEGKKSNGDTYSTRSEAKLRSCGDIAEIFKVAKRKKNGVFRKLRGEDVATMCVYGGVEVSKE